MCLVTLKERLICHWDSQPKLFGGVEGGVIGCNFAVLSSGGGKEKKNPTETGWVKPVIFHCLITSNCPMRTSVISHPLLLSLWKMSHFPGHKEAFYCLNRLSFLNAYSCIPKKKILKTKVTRVKWSTCKMQHLSTMDDHGVETNLFRMLVFRSIHSWNIHTHTCLRSSTCGTAIVLAQLFCFDGGRQKSERTSQAD